MTDLTPAVNELLKSRGTSRLSGETANPSDFQGVDEFLKEAHRINFHISSLLAYLKSIRTTYLSTAPARATTSSNPDFNPNPLNPGSISTHLTDPDRDAIDSSTASLLQDLSRSIGNLASAESLRSQTQASILRKKYGHGKLNERLWQWAGGGGGTVEVPRTPEQEQAEDTEKNLAGVRESVLWFLRRGLESAAEVQRGMVEKRIER
ncbi:hypothetical protein FQN49_005446, partial [Arthroderma sp. PD_2]